MEKEKNRRHFLKIGAGAVGAALIANPFKEAVAAVCEATPDQTSGPFYPGESVFKSEHDLTRIPGRSKRAEGQMVYIRGRVLESEGCSPLENANVEIWQACASGKYNNPKDPNPAPIDPNFLYWSECFTNTQGEYWFKTIIPGAYPASSNWIRPPHIHFKISCLGYHELITQMYFKGHSLNEADRILQQLPAKERDAVIVEFRPASNDFEPGALIGEFDITLKPVR
jgi:protocatechuate 3,4-dioxygenase beta subunit